MVSKLRVFLVMLAALGLGGCVSPPPPLPTPAPTAVLPTPIRPTANAVLSAADPPASPTPAPSPPVAAPPTAVTQAPPVVLATAAALPSPPPDALPVPSPAAASDAPADGRAAVIGFSARGRPLTDFQFGSGPNQIVLVGGMHGGYEWNTILLAYRLVDYFTQNPDKIPEAVTLHIIPAANPDGQFAVVGRDGRFSPSDVDTADNFSGRFNSNEVDLNRNWDCQWQATGTWRDQEIDAGEFPFSEPEAAALRDFFLALQPAAVVFWHSAANGAYGAGCPALYQPAYDLARLYGSAAGYPVYESFTSYQVTGDASDWLALQGIPAITVELETHEALDWEKNLAGVTAVFGPYVSDE